MVAREFMKNSSFQIDLAGRIPEVDLRLRQRQGRQAHGRGGRRIHPRSGGCPPAVGRDSQQGGQPPGLAASRTLVLTCSWNMVMNNGLGCWVRYLMVMACFLGENLRFGKLSATPTSAPASAARTVAHMEGRVSLAKRAA
jgi:hypothetical protein